MVSMQLREHALYVWRGIYSEAFWCVDIPAACAGSRFNGLHRLLRDLVPIRSTSRTSPRYRSQSFVLADVTRADDCGIAPVFSMRETRYSEDEIV